MSVQSVQGDSNSHDSDKASLSGSDHSSDITAVDVDGKDEEEEQTDSSSSESQDEEENSMISWTGYGKRIPVLIFRAVSLVHRRPELKAIGEKYHLAYKMMKTECKLIRSILGAHGFHEAHPNSNDFNLMWTGSHLKPYVLRGLQEFQKVNHFPRSYEITRKDRLYKNIQRMQQTKGFKHFDFVPYSFIVPGEFQDFCSCFLKDKGPWIVKPIASSRGRGIMLVNHPEQVPLDETMIVSKYLSNPLLIDGFKFDIRLYVAVTSYDPLVVYLYEEGLTRFATVRYDKGPKTIRNQCMHLTNYSVNKKSHDYVKNDDPDLEDYGNKWSLGAMLRYLRAQGKDTTAIMMRIEDVIIKTLISAELPIATACKMFMPSRGNCFELYGFDILIDDNLRPWVLEVNLSPSLACDSPLDLKIKSNLMADLFTLVGFVCHDPMLRKMTQSKRNQDVLGKPPSRVQSAMSRTRPFVAQKAQYLWRSKRQRPQSASSVGKLGAKGFGMSSCLNSEEIKIVRRAKEENSRRAGWVRIFPTSDSWELYGSFLQYTTTHNLTLYQQLYPDRAKTASLKPTTASYSSGLARQRVIHLHGSVQSSSQMDEAMAQALQRSLQYERKLSNNTTRRRRPSAKQRPVSNGAPNVKGNFKGSLVQGVPQDSKTTVNKSTRPPQFVANKPPQKKEDLQQKETPSTAMASKPGEIPKPKEPEKPTTTVNKPKPPPPKPPEPKYNVVGLLEKGRTMSKVQARHAFATYLTRVQHRLLSETNATDQEDVDAANEQMDLVLRFLKRAAGNLQQPFKVVVPSRKLALNDRRRILAKQLGDFVHIYNKETEQLKQRNNIDRKHLRRPPAFTQNDGLDEEKFSQFVSKASESALEEVLTTYTKLNKSASIFLGSNSKSTYDHKQPSSGSTMAHSHSDTSLAKRKESFDNSASQHHHKGAQEDVTETGGVDEAVPGNVRPPSGSIAASNSQSSYTSAVAIYSTRLAGQQLPARQRPVSATSHRSSVHSVRTRPGSAYTIRTASSSGSRQAFVAPRVGRADGAECNGQPSVEEMNAALQRLALRQQQRQYMAPKNPTLLSGTGPELGSNEALLVNNHPTSLPAEVSMSHTQAAHVHAQSDMPLISNEACDGVRTNGHAPSSASETFDKFVANAYFDPDMTAAYNQVTGARGFGNGYATAMGSNGQLHQLIQQQRMMEQSKALLEQSKSKHQAMIAQAHAAHKSKQEELPSQILAPKPPDKPVSEKKPTSAHRIARTALVEDGQNNPNFYNSLKYDSNTGSAKPVYSSGSNTGF